MFNIKNNCQFMGRLVEDPKSTVRQSANGPYTTITFRIAVNRSLSAQQKQENTAAKSSGQQEPHKSADFIGFKASGVMAENIAKYFTKGKPILLQASYEEYSVVSQTTQQREFKSIFKVENFAFTDNDNTQGQGQNQQAPQNAYGQQPYGQPQGGFPGAQQPPQQQYQQTPQQQYQQPQGGFPGAQQPQQQYQQKPQQQAPQQYQQPQGGFPNPQNVPGNFQLEDDDDVPF